MGVTNFSVTIGTITYYAFPTFAELNRYRPDVVAQILIFFRMIGLCSIRQINRAIGNDEDDYRIQWMLTHANIPDHVDESHAAENIAYTEEIQREILGDDTKHYFVKVTDVAAKLHKIHNVSPQKALNEIFNELKGIAKTPERKEKKMKEKVVEPEIVAQSTPPTSVTIQPEDEQRIQRVAAECPVRPIRDWSKARKDTEYLRQVVSYFPEATNFMYTKYLYNVTLTTIGNAFHQAGAKREKTSNRHPSSQDIYGRAAFVAWAGGDWREYLTENLPLVDVKRLQPTPVKEPVEEPVAEPAAEASEPEWNTCGDDLDLQPKEEKEWTRLEDCQEWQDYADKKEPAAPIDPPAPAEKPAPVEPPAPIEKPAPVEKPAPAAPDKPDFIAEIKLSAKNPEILRILNWLETDATAEILDYTVYRPTAK